MFSRRWCTYFLVILFKVVSVIINLFYLFGPALLADLINPWFFLLYIITGPAFAATMLITIMDK